MSLNFSKLSDVLKDYAASAGKAVEAYGKNVATNAKAIVRPNAPAATDDQVAPTGVTR